MAVYCPDCRKQYDVTLFAFGNTLRCDCGRFLRAGAGGGTIHLSARDVGRPDRVVSAGPEDRGEFKELMRLLVLLLEDPDND
ncbi:MAG: hypothetical protein HY720_23805 [Planctomycetes bacterium]|nr:hypothetical protein [Planctomycetota bacterium]